MSNNTSLFTQMLETPVIGGMFSPTQGNLGIASSERLPNFYNLLVGLMRPSAPGLDNASISSPYNNSKFERDSFLDYWLSGAFDEVDNNNLALLKDKLASSKEKTLSPEQVSALLGVQNQQLLELLQAIHKPDIIENNNHDKSHTTHGWDISIQEVLKQDFQPTALPLPNLSLSQLQNLIPLLPQQVPSYTSSNQFSEEFTDMLKKAYTQQQSVRVALSDETAVVLKFNNTGKVSAHFLTSSAADEWQLKQQLTDLQQRLDAKDLPYDELTVNPDGQRRRNNRGNKE